MPADSNLGVRLPPELLKIHNRSVEFIGPGDAGRAVPARFVVAPRGDDCFTVLVVVPHGEVPPGNPGNEEVIPLTQEEVDRIVEAPPGSWPEYRCHLRVQGP